MQGQNVSDEFLKVPVYRQTGKYDDAQQGEYDNATVFHLMTFIGQCLSRGELLRPYRVGYYSTAFPVWKRP
jgi:hypothetical protein